MRSSRRSRNGPGTALLAVLALAAVPFALQSGALQAGAEQDAPQSSMRGERLAPEALGPGGTGRIVDMLELHELEKTLPRSRTVQRMRNGASGEWVVPSMGAAGEARSGRYYITNEWGDTRIGIAFPEIVDLDGVWVAGQSAQPVWTDELVVVGYRAGEKVARSEPFTAIDAEPAWFATGLLGVDRVVFEAGPVVGGAGWYALDDLTYTPRAADGSRAATVVLDFEDLDYKWRLTGSGYRGLTWERGSGTFEEEARAIDQPLFPGAGAADEPQGGEGSEPPPSGGSGTAPTLVQSFEGAKIFDPGAGFIPPDTCGFVGIDHFVEVVNTNYSVYEKTTNDRVVNISMSSFFGVGGNPGDPRVVFDPHSQRWFVIATNFSDRVYLAVSLTSDPTGSYFSTSFLTSQGIDAGKFPDYPTLGVDANGVYVGAAMFSSGATMTIFALDKAPLIALSPSLGTISAFRGFGFEGAIQPCVTYGNPGREYFVSRWSSTALRLREVVPPLTSPTLNDLGSVSIPAHAFPPDAPALGSGVPLDSVDHRPMNAVFRGGSVWTIHAVDVSGRSSARWYEIDPGTVSTDQVGTIQDSQLAFIMPSIAVNSAGDCAMGFTGSSANQYAATYFTGRLATDPPGQVAGPVQFKAGEGAYQRLDGIGRNRWGDYSLTSVDPVDDLTFWTVQEYARTSDNWGTWIAELEFPTFPDCNGNGIDDAEDIASGTSEDCNGNGIPDECEADCDGDEVPDDCEADCNGNGIPDDCETFTDCNGNGIPDECEPDCDGDEVPDNCEEDCDGNGVPDDCETLADCDADGTPDVCEPDCDADGLPDDCEEDCDGHGVPDDCEAFADCNENGIPDECDIADGTSQDVNGNGVPDECECAATNYCIGAPNSVGPGSVLFPEGTPSVSLNDFDIRATGCPPGQFGIFFFGPDPIQIPFGNGFRCVGGGIVRFLPPILVGAAGEALLDLDVTAPPASGAIVAGSLWNFQFWYRDPAAGGAAFNLSDGLSVRFCE